MENNALQVNYSQWEAGKQYPEWMDEISLATISKGYLMSTFNNLLTLDVRNFFLFFTYPSLTKHYTKNARK